MKITLEPTEHKETEIIIRGNITSPEAESVLKFLNSKKTSNKLILYREDEQFITDISDILYFEAGNNKVTAITISGDYESKCKLYELKEKLATFNFAQISKSVILNVDYAKSVSAEFSGNYTVTLKNRKETLIISRKFFKGFKNQI